MHEEDIDFEEEGVNGKGLSALFALEKKTVHTRVGPHLLGWRFSALEFHGLAAVGEVFIPGDIIVSTPVAGDLSCHSSVIVFCGSHRPYYRPFKEYDRIDFRIVTVKGVFSSSSNPFQGPSPMRVIKEATGWTEAIFCYIIKKLVKNSTLCHNCMVFAKNARILCEKEP